jgi:hypothetical protein
MPVAGGTPQRDQVGNYVAMSEQQPRVRRAPIPDDAVLVVRGDDLEPRNGRAQALAFRRRFPGWDRWGLSAYYARSEAEIDDLAADQLERFPSSWCYRSAPSKRPALRSWRRFAPPRDHRVRR